MGDRVDMREGHSPNLLSNLSLGAWSVTGAVVLVTTLYGLSLYSYLLFHTVVEVFVIAVTLCIFFITWNSRNYISNGYLLFLGVAYLFVGIFDLLHTLAYKGLGIFQGYDADLPTQLWIAARYIEGVSLLLASLFFERRPNLSVQIICYSFASAAILLSIFYFDSFPACFIEGQGLTQFKIISEYIICGLLLAAMLALVRARSHFENRVFWLLVGAIGTTIVTELTFTLYISVYGFSNLLGHYFKLLSFYLIYKALIETGFRQPYDLLFRELGLERERLQKEILQRENLEQALRRSEECYRIVADFAYDWEFWIDPNGKFVYVSPSCERITGYPAAEFLDNPKLFLEIVHEDDRPLVEEHLESVLSREQLDASTFDFRIVHKDGSVRWVNHSCQAVKGDDGTYLGRRASNRDVTEAKRAIDLVRQSDRHRAVADLAGGIAHNFNNLLQIVISGIENSISDMEDGDMEKSKESLEIILESCDRGAETVRKLLHFASARSDNQNSGFRMVELGDLVKESVEVSRPFWEDGAVKEGVQIEMKVNCKPDVYVKGRFNQLVDVVISLIRNASEAIKEHGVIEITVDRQGDEGVIMVRDSGVGIGPSDLNRIFTPFFTTKVSAGSGLALATALKVIGDHGGKIDVDSELGRGSSFRVRIPISAKTEAPETTGPCNALAKGMRMLVVDDAKVVTNMLGAALSKEGYIIETATSGTDAIEIFRKNPADAIICDLGMPDINGVELCRRIKAIAEYRGIMKPVSIIVTGWEQKLTPEFMKAGVDDVLRKPVKIGMLLASLDRNFRNCATSKSA